MDMVGRAEKAVQPLRVSDVLVDGDDNLLGLLEEPVVTPVRVHLWGSIQLTKEFLGKFLGKFWGKNSGKFWGMLVKPFKCSSYICSCQFQISGHLFAKYLAKIYVN